MILWKAEIALAIVSPKHNRGQGHIKGHGGAGILYNTVVRDRNSYGSSVKSSGGFEAPSSCFLCLFEGDRFALFHRKDGLGGIGLCGNYLTLIWNLTGIYAEVLGYLE